MLTSHFTSASKASVLPRAHRSANALTLSSASRRRSQLQTRGFRLVAKSSYYHRLTDSVGSDIDILNRRLTDCVSRDIEILNRRLAVHRQAGIHFSFSKDACDPRIVLCKRKSQIKDLKHDSNHSAVYFARTTFTSYKPKEQDQPRSLQSYVAERNVSRRIPRYCPPKPRNSDNVEYAIPVKTFGGHRPQSNPPVGLYPKESDKPIQQPAPSDRASYVSDSELYLDGRTLEQELKPYYKPVKHNEPDGISVELPCPVREALKEFDARPATNYDGFGYNEPDGKPPGEPSTVKQGLAEYDQTAKYGGTKPFAFNEPDGLLMEPQSTVENALNEYDQTAEANDYKSIAHNEPDGQLPQEPCKVEAALSEYDQKWEPKIENDNFFFDEDFKNELEDIAATAPTTAAQDATKATKSNIKSEHELINSVPLRKIKTSAGFKKGKKDTSDERKARRAKLEADFERSSVEFVRDIEAIRKSNKIRHSKQQLEEFEIAASVLLNQYHHLRGKIDARLEELEAEDKKASVGNTDRDEVSTGGAAFSNTIESTATTHPFKSGIDVRREEDVFSGGRRQRKWERRQRRASAAKRVLGGAVAGAGVFYAAGVVSEFFTTGGGEETAAVGL